jgi:tetratricopeptide repeat protein 30
MGVGVTTEGIELPSVGNTLTLHETAFIEAFNLKAAFEFDIQNRKYFKINCNFAKYSF